MFTPSVLLPMIAGNRAYGPAPNLRQTAMMRPPSRRGIQHPRLRLSDGMAAVMDPQAYVEKSELLQALAHLYQKRCLMTTNMTLQTGISTSVNRTSFTPTDVVHNIWTLLNLPPHALQALDLPVHNGPALPSSFKIGIIAQSSIALSALAASLIHGTRTSKPVVPRIHVAQERAVVEFRSERLYTLNGKPPPSAWGAIGGLHETLDGYVRIHDAFPNHALATLDFLGLPHTATREDVAGEVAQWTSIDLETRATTEGNAAIYALRTYEQWDATPQASAISNNPILLHQFAPGPPKMLPSTSSRKCLHGLRVLEMSRVIAAPLAGKTLAAHGADVLWVTSPSLPDIPAVDRDLGRGKRTIQLDIHNAADKARLLGLLRTCDVFIQGFRPGSLAAHDLSPEILARANPNIICANMSAFGPHGPWASRRGFDSLVQTCTGMNVSEAAHFGTTGEPNAARPLPCQALDHAAGYLLATGILAALHHRGTQGGAWRVDVSLAGVMRYLRSLGQYPVATGFACDGVDVPGSDDGGGLGEAVKEEGFFETRETGFGMMTAVSHSASVEGCEVGWDMMPKPLGSDKAEWVDV